jgi:hypothetical protein
MQGADEAALRQTSVTCLVGGGRRSFGALPLNPWGDVDAVVGCRARRALDVPACRG